MARLPVACIPMHARPVSPLSPRVCAQDMPTDFLLGDVFEMFFDEHAVKQIQACGSALRELFDGSDDKRRTQRVILDGVVSLVTAPMGMAPKHGEAMLKKTPAILMALCALAPPMTRPNQCPMPHARIKRADPAQAFGFCVTPRLSRPRPAPADTTTASSRRLRSSSGMHGSLAKRTAQGFANLSQRLGLRCVRRPRHSSSGYGKPRRRPWPGQPTRAAGQTSSRTP